MVKYFADESVGRLGIGGLRGFEYRALENVYRSFYNRLRVSESRRCSTPVRNGPLIAFRKELLYEIGPLPEYAGNDDSTPASIIAFAGYRAIQVDDVVAREYVRGNQFWRRVRRAQHLLVHFLRTKRWARERNLYCSRNRCRGFEAVWRIKWWLHLANPWLLLASVVLLLVSCAFRSIASAAMLSAGALLLVNRTSRAWVVNQLYLIVAAVKNIKSVDIAWAK